MNIPRIEHAIKVLEGVQPKQWDYLGWADRFGCRGGIAAATCQTVACAGGWLGLNAICNASGLYLGISGLPQYQGKSGRAALAAYFDIGVSAAHGIFVALHEAMSQRQERQVYRHEVTPADVAQALRDLLPVAVLPAAVLPAYA